MVYTAIKFYRIDHKSYIIHTKAVFACSGVALIAMVQ